MMAAGRSWSRGWVFIQGGLLMLPETKGRSLASLERRAEGGSRSGSLLRRRQPGLHHGRLRNASWRGAEYPKAAKLDEGWAGRRMDFAATGRAEGRRTIPSKQDTQSHPSG
jgi:hypothetical protein